MKNVTREPSPVSSNARRGPSFHAKGSGDDNQVQGSNINYVNAGIVDEKGIHIEDVNGPNIIDEKGPTHAELMAFWRSGGAKDPTADNRKHDMHVMSNMVHDDGAGGMDAGLIARAPATGAVATDGCVDAGLSARAPVAATTTANTTSTASHSPTSPF